MADTINPQLLQQLLNLNSNEVIIPLRLEREEVRKIKAVDLSDQEALLVQAFQDFLVAWGYLPNNTFESLFIYVFNLACALHKPVVEHEAQEGRAVDTDTRALKAQD